MLARGLGIASLFSAPGLGQKVDIALLANRVSGSGAGTGLHQITGTRQRVVAEDVFTERAVTRREPVFGTEAVTETRDKVEARPIWETRAVFAERAVFTDEAEFEDRAVYGQRAVYETRAVYEDRATYEDRAVYEDRDIRRTEVNGARNVRDAAGPAQAGIDIGADFSVQVGGAGKAVLRFNSATRLSVTDERGTRSFDFSSASAGSFGEAVRAALDSVDGLDAAFSADGKLTLKTADAKSLAIAEVQNGFLDFSGSPLAKLGLSEGTTQSRVVGTERVQTGTTRVQTGTTRVQTGTEQVEVGTETVQTGTERVQTGTRRVQTGTERFQSGTEDVQVGVEEVKTGTESVVTGYRQVQTGETELTLGTERVKTGTVFRTVTEAAEVVGLEREGAAAALDRLARSPALAGYLGLLFRPLDAPAAQGRTMDEARQAYGEVETLRGERGRPASVRQGDEGTTGRKA
jgi:hypothetical protein